MCGWPAGACRSSSTGHLVGVDAGKAWDVFSRETESAALLGATVEIPNEAARCTIVALHAAQHGVAQRAIFGDLEKALMVADTATWRRAADLARSAGGWTPFAGALSLSSQGRELLAELGEPLPALSERQALSLLTPAPTSRGFYFLDAYPECARRALSCCCQAGTFAGLHAPALSARAPRAGGLDTCVRVPTAVACPLGVAGTSNLAQCAASGQERARGRPARWQPPVARTTAQRSFSAS